LVRVVVFGLVVCGWGCLCVFFGVCCLSVFGVWVLFCFWGVFSDGVFCSPLEESLKAILMLHGTGLHGIKNVKGGSAANRGQPSARAIARFSETEEERLLVFEEERPPIESYQNH